MSNRATKIVGAGLPPLNATQIAGDLQTGVTAAGTTQGTAASVYGDNVVVTTAASSSGVILSGPAFGPGDDVFITNQGANTLSVYPPVGGQINALGANAAFSIAAGKQTFFRSVGGNQFYAMAAA